MGTLRNFISSLTILLFSLFPKRLDCHIKSHTAQFLGVVSLPLCPGLACWRGSLSSGSGNISAGFLLAIRGENLASDEHNVPGLCRWYKKVHQVPSSRARQSGSQRRAAQEGSPPPIGTSLLAVNPRLSFILLQLSDIRVALLLLRRIAGSDRKEITDNISALKLSSGNRETSRSSWLSVLGKEKPREIVALKQHPAGGMQMSPLIVLLLADVHFINPWVGSQLTSLP